MNGSFPNARTLSWLLIVALVLIILRLVALPLRLESVFLVGFTAVLIAAAVAPAATALERRRVPRGVTVLGIYVIALLVLTGVVALIVPLIANEVELLRQRSPEYQENVRDFIRRFAPDQADQLTADRLVEVGSSQVEGYVTAVPGVAISFSGLVVRIVIVLVMGYFMAVEEHFAERVMRRFTPPRYRDRIGRLLGTIGDQLGHWARAQLLLAVSFGFTFGLGLRLLGVEYAVTLGVIGGVLEIIPYVGGFVTVILALLVASTEGWLTVVGVLVWYAIVVQAEAHILAPKLMERTLGLHPLVVVMALFVGAESLGILGALLAVPIAVVIQAVLNEFYAAAPSDPPPSSAAAVSMPAAAVPAPGDGATAGPPPDEPTR